VPVVYLNVAFSSKRLVTVLINRILVSIKHEADVAEDFKMYSDVVCVSQDASDIWPFVKRR
jgi:hypothetical protein